MTMTAAGSPREQRAGTPRGSTMDDIASEPAEPEPLRTRDWIRAVLWIGVLVVVIAVGWVALLSAMCGCTVPAA